MARSVHPEHQSCFACNLDTLELSISSFVLLMTASDEEAIVSWCAVTYCVDEDLALDRRKEKKGRRHTIERQAEEGTGRNSTKQGDANNGSALAHSTFNSTMNKSQLSFLLAALDVLPEGQRSPLRTSLLFTTFTSSSSCSYLVLSIATLCLCTNSATHARTNTHTHTYAQTRTVWVGSHGAKEIPHSW